MATITSTKNSASSGGTSFTIHPGSETVWFDVTSSGPDVAYIAENLTPDDAKKMHAALGDAIRKFDPEFGKAPEMEKWKHVETVHHSTVIEASDDIPPQVRITLGNGQANSLVSVLQTANVGPLTRQAVSKAAQVMPAPTLLRDIKAGTKFRKLNGRFTYIKLDAFDTMKDWLRQTSAQFDQELIMEIGTGNIYREHGELEVELVDVPDES